MLAERKLAMPDGRGSATVVLLDESPLSELTLAVLDDGRGSATVALQNGRPLDAG